MTRKALRRRGGPVDALRTLRLRAEPGGGAGGARGGVVLLRRETEGRDGPDEGERDGASKAPFYKKYRLETRVHG